MCQFTSLLTEHFDLFSFPDKNSDEKEVKLKNQDLDQYQYLGNYPPTPTPTSPLTQH